MLVTLAGIVYGGTGFGRRVLDECSLALVEQNPGHTTIYEIMCIHRYRSQTGATIEPMILDVRDAGGDGNAGQDNTIERIESRYW